MSSMHTPNSRDESAAATTEARESAINLCRGCKQVMIPKPYAYCSGCWPLNRDRENVPAGAHVCLKCGRDLGELIVAFESGEEAYNYHYDSFHREAKHDASA